MDGRVDAAKCGSVIPEPLAELYARGLLRALRPAADCGAAETKEQATSAAKKCPPRPPMGLVQLAVSESVQHYVLVGGKPLVKEAAEADTNWRQLADAGDWTAVRADLSVYEFSGEKVDQDPRL